MPLNAPSNISKSIAVGLALAMLTLPAAAQDAGARGAALIKYRQSIYTVLGANFGQMGAVVQGKAPFDATDFARRADRVAYMAQMAPEAFPPDSQSGAPTKAKPAIWKDKAEFDRLMKDMQEKTNALAQVSKAGDLERIKPAFIAAGGACKSCHDKFKEE